MSNRRGVPRVTHGKSHSRVYQCWSNMIQRCTNSKHRKYADYGGRGITVCEQWRTFANFYADMGDPPPEMSLDRADNDGHYEPSNCRWVGWSVQQSNKRKPAKPRRTHCTHGHALSPENTSRSSSGALICKICRAATVRRYRHNAAARAA